jgi:hypothetical protein
MSATVIGCGEGVGVGGTGVGVGATVGGGDVGDGVGVGAGLQAAIPTTIRAISRGVRMRVNSFIGDLL